MSQADPAVPRRPEAQQIDARALVHQLERLARAEAAPWLHADVAQRMAERLPVIKLQPSRVLQWSAFLADSDAALRQAYPQAVQLLAEPLPALQARSQAQHRRGWLDALRRRAEAEVWLPQQVPDGGAELVWSNLSLHLSPDPEALLARWYRALAVDGFLMFSCLGPDSLRELRPLFAAQGWGLPGPEWMDMHDIGDMLVAAGFADPVMDQERITLTWREPQRLIDDLRSLGGNLSPTRFAGLRTGAWRGRLLEALEALRGPDGLLRLSLELVHGHAFKPAPRPRLNAETRVSLDEMRAMVRGTDRS